MRRNYRLAEDYFVENGLMPSRKVRKERWVLHHKDVTLKDSDPERYAEWRIEDLVPMTLSDHSKLHNSGENNPLYGAVRSEETKKKLSDAKLGKTNWSKGLSKETDERVAKRSIKLKGRVSPTKGKKFPGRHWKLVDGKHIYY